MHTLFDFITHIKGIEYVIAIMAIGGYILYWEVLKPKPFRTLVRSAREDLGYVKEVGYRNTMKMAGRIVAAPFIGLAYIVALPFAFFFAVIFTVLGGLYSMIGKSVSFEWRPMEAYLSGRKQGRKRKQGEIQEAEKSGEDNKE
ncbi:hypothetical protein BMS3Abin07_02111 [bacterium BMS3Abin07]|nr:hypothetical protein BMS3Abin07_02111 [bacterium BMS3Abin07]GBE32548.1 hypothetical protein BMS3Bbin05_01464 [bacterium BMS3Bbin05]HDO22255.1 hypothetical protein [Nitrospirota bacterium]HDZ88329.1 hypothetical protein [Nitrospirota bacterium]